MTASPSRSLLRGNPDISPGSVTAGPWRAAPGTLVGVAAVDVMDETFLAVAPARVAAEFTAPAVWARLWPDLRLTVLADRGDQGFRWTVSGSWTGSMEVWIEPVLDGAVLHYFLRVDPTGSGASPRALTREAARRGRGAKAVAFALKDRLEGDRAPGEPPRPHHAPPPSAPAGPGPPGFREGRVTGA